MGCTGSTVTELTAAWSKGSTSTVLAHVLIAEMNSADVHKARVSFYLESNSGNATVQAFYEFGNDGVTWDGTNAFGPATSATEGWTYGTTFEDLTTGSPATRRLRIRFGVLVKNVSGTAIEYCRVRIQLDREGTG